MLRSSLGGWVVVCTGFETCPTVSFGSSSVKTSGFATIELFTQ
jgi:hypothetical protein